MAKFNVGDRVVITRKANYADGVHHYFRKGTKGTIIEINTIDGIHLVKESKWWWIFPLYKMEQYVPEDCLELVE